MNIRRKGQGHRVTKCRDNVATRQSCGTVSLQWCSVDGPARPSRRTTTQTRSGRRQLCTLSSAQPLVVIVFPIRRRRVSGLLM